MGDGGSERLRRFAIVLDIARLPRNTYTHMSRPTSRPSRAHVAHAHVQQFGIGVRACASIPHLSFSAIMRMAGVSAAGSSIVGTGSARKVFAYRRHARWKIRAAHVGSRRAAEARGRNVRPHAQSERPACARSAAARRAAEALTVRAEHELESQRVEALPNLQSTKNEKAIDISWRSKVQSANMWTNWPLKVG